MKVLVLTAHPNLGSSQINKVWFDALSSAPDVTTRNLTEIGGPTMAFDVAKEQAELLVYDRIIFQFPFYWYSAPPVLKAWMDQVMSYGFAYGPRGDKLSGREFLLLISTGGPEDSYHAGGYNNFSMDEFLKPFQQTALLAHMRYLRPFIFHGMARATTKEVEASTLPMLHHICDPELDPAVRQTRLLKELDAGTERAAAVS